ncbi:MAG: class I SAM-dependent methyltransferase [Pyrinomonadaceae bacterium]|nr:class I SAM-dependent methyltransferase [Pyrinomonadaceae bacterium]
MSKLSTIEQLTASKLAEISVFRRAGQKISELTDLVSLVQKEKLNTIVEIGTDRGGTFWLWCQLAEKDALIVSIDLPGGDYGEGYSAEDAERFKTWGKPGQQLEFLLKDSHAEETKDLLRSILGSREIDLLFIDGDHRYEGVTQDFNMYAPLVKEGGFVVFHDIVETLPRLNCHSHRFWNEVKQNYRHLEFIDIDDDLAFRVDNDLEGPWGGIGVLYYKKNGGAE